MLTQSLQIPLRNEINLFRTMLQYFVTHYPTATYIKETHKHIVDFNCVDPLNRLVWATHREIADLLLITFSPLQNEIRITFLQAKYDKKFNSPRYHFKGDVFQWCLLAQRPIIYDRHNHFPNNILQAGILDSIGSFGIFYIENGVVEFAYSTASQINLVSQKSIKSTNPKRQLYFMNHQKCTITHNNLNNLQESTTILRANDFEQELIQLRIGSPISRQDIVAILGTQANNPFIQKFYISMGWQVSDQLEGGYLGNILLLNVDECSQS